MLGYEIANIIFHVILISSFLVVFFFRYASKVENQIVQIQSKEIVSDISSDIKLVTPSQYLPIIGKNLDIQVPDLSIEDQKVELSNKALYDKTVRTIIIIFTIGILIIFTMSIIFKFSMKDIFIHNIIILFAVALTEYLFLTYFARNYITIDSNYVKYVALQTINNKL